METLRATKPSGERVTVVEIMRTYALVQTAHGELDLVPLHSIEFDEPTSLLDWVRSDAWVDGVSYADYSKLKLKVG
jgi:hypothetical protein